MTELLRGKRLLTLTLLLLALLFVAPPLLSQERREPVRVPRGHFVPEFRDIEVRDFLKTMARIIKRNILIDDTVKGKITIVSYKPIPVKEALNFLKQVLEVRGYAVVEESNLIKVLTMEAASSVDVPRERDADMVEESAGVVSKVVRLPASANINELSALLRNLLGKDTKVVPYRSSNSMVLTGYAPSVKRALAIIKRVAPGSDEMTKDTDISDSGDTIHIYRVKNMPADSLAQVLVRLDNPLVALAQEGEGKTPAPAATRRPAGPASKIKAVAHKESNSIIVTASQPEWREIRRIIENLDKLRSQILLEVLIAEVTSNNLNDFGIDWRYQGADAAHTQFNTGLAVEGEMLDPDTGRITGNNTLSGFSLGFLDRGGDLLGIFNANISNSNFNVLSAPQVLTLDNQEAEINVGQDVPVRTQERTSGGGPSQATVNSYEYRPSGISLKFTPHVSADGKISLDLFAEVTNIEGGASAITNPTFSKRNVKTYVTVGNKQTIVIGGLVSTEKLQAVKKIPLLGDIPFLGFLFRRTTYTTKKTNLMVFLTPHILDKREEADRISNYKRTEQIRASRKRANELKLFPEPKAPPALRQPVEE